MVLLGPSCSNSIIRGVNFLVGPGRIYGGKMAQARGFRFRPYTVASANNCQELEVEERLVEVLVTA